MLLMPISRRQGTDKRAGLIRTCLEKSWVIPRVDIGHELRLLDHASKKVAHRTARLHRIGADICALDDPDLRMLIGGLLSVTLLYHPP